MKISRYIVFVMLLYPVRLFSQEVGDTTDIDMSDSIMVLSDSPEADQHYLLPDTPPSPQAVAFNRLGDYEVSNNYGVPDISIPLFEIDFHGYKIPLALHYEAMPMKSGYNYDVTGLGWTLSGNSCVSRTIKDRADELSPYSFSSPFKLDSFGDNTVSGWDYSGYINDANFQYDSYNVVLPSGRTIPFFMYKNDNGVMQFDKLSWDSNVIIECDYSHNSIDGFTVTDENGVIYCFTIADKGSNNFENDPNALRNVTWLLTSITVPGKGTIEYSYNNDVNIHATIIDEPVLKLTRVCSQMTEDRTLPRLGATETVIQQSPAYIMRFIKRIHFGPTRVDFNYEDQGKHMKEIAVIENNDTIRRFTLNISDSNLSSLVISGQNNEDKLEYGFEYHPNNYINRGPSGLYTDFWGNLCESSTCHDIGNFNMYINNREDGNFPIDTVLIQSQIEGVARFVPNKEHDDPYYYKVKLQPQVYGEKRQPTSPESHGVLSSITYPNGGHTLFTFENNRFLTASAEDGDIVFDRRKQRVKEGGGFRIKSITNYTADNLVANEEHYRYGLTYGDIPNSNIPLPIPEDYDSNEHIGCGEAVVDPNLLTFMNYSYYADREIADGEFQRMAVGLNSAFKSFYDIHGSTTWWDAEFSACTFRSLLGGRRPVVYPEITVYHGNPDEHGACNSKTVYKYDIYKYTHNPQTYYMSYLSNTLSPDTAYCEDVYYYSGAPRLVTREYPGKRHQLSSKLEYALNVDNGTWNLFSEEKYKYIESSMTQIGSIFNSKISREYHTCYASELGGTQWWMRNNMNAFYITLENQFCGRNNMSRKTTTIYREGGGISRENTITENYEYQYPGAMKKNMSSSLYNTKGTGISYIGEEESNNSVIAEMKSRNMLASVLTSTTYADINDGTPFAISGNKIEYGFYGTRILPSRLYEYNQRDQYYSEEVPVDNSEFEESLKVESYDSYSNPTEITDSKTGIHTVFLWDTYGRYMTAMIQNATCEDLESVSSQITGDSRARQAALQQYLPNSQIETWDYKPLVGVSSHTDASGRTILYEYDGLGRLKSEKRVVNGVTKPEIIKEYEYNFINEPTWVR